MSQKASPAVVGTFVLGAIALTVAAVLAFGGGMLARESSRYVVYFEGSVVGLDRGAPVLFRGVPVGTVGDIKGRFYAEDASIVIAVYVDLLAGSLDTVGTTEESQDEAIDRLVARGMRAQLGLQSLVTGKAFVAMVMDPDQEAVYRAPDDEFHPEIPSIPTQLEQVESTFRSLAERIGGLPIEEVLTEMQTTLRAASELLEDPGLKAAVADLDDTVGAFRRLAESTDAQVTPVGTSFQEAAEQANRALVSMETALEEISRDYSAGSPIQHEAIRAMQQVNDAARAFRQLSETLTNQPDSFIFGRRVEDSP